MKLRYALASAAATAAIAPAALFTAGAAHADASPAATVTTPATTATTSAAAATTTATATTATTAPTTTATTPSATATTASGTPSTTATSPADGTDCDTPDGKDPKVDDKLTAGVSGLPSVVKAGSGWHGFKLAVANSSDTDYRRVDFGLFATEINASDWSVDTSHLKIQFQNPDTGKWSAVSLDDDDPGEGYLGYTEVEPKASFDLKLRLAVDSSAKAGDGFVIGVGIYADDSGACVIAGGAQTPSQFEVVATDGSTGGSNGNGGTQSGGQAPLPPKPAGDTQLNPPGTDLAETGSSSSLPAVAAVGGGVVVLGAGAVFLVRRRKSAAGGVAAG